MVNSHSEQSVLGCPGTLEPKPIPCLCVLFCNSATAIGVLTRYKHGPLQCQVWTAWPWSGGDEPHHHYRLYTTAVLPQLYCQPSTGVENRAQPQVPESFRVAMGHLLWTP